MIEKILKDYSNYPICCLYIQEVRYSFSKSYMRPIYYSPEKIVNIEIQEIGKIQCNAKKSCHSKYRIRVHSIYGLVYYQCNQKWFRSLYHARNYAKGKKEKFVKFGIESRLLFKKDEAPTIINNDRKFFRERSRSVV